MALPPTASSASPPPSSSFSCFPDSFSSFFLSCFQTRRNKKGRRSPNPPTATPKNRASCSHAATARTCTCAHVSAANAITEKEPEALPSIDPNSISITQTTSIRIVESDSSSDYDSRTSLDSELNSVSDYGCGCGSEALEHEQHVCDDNDDEKLPARPLPPLPSHAPSAIQHTPSRKHPDIKTRLIDETILEEDEDEYLQQQESQSQPESQEQDSTKHSKRTTTSRRKSMIELFNLSSSRPGPTSSSSVVTGPGLSLSFSNLHFKFPLPPAWGQQQQEHRRDDDEGKQGQSQGQGQVQKAERRRPMSTSVLPSSTPSATAFTAASTGSPQRKSKKQDRGVSLHTALTQSGPAEKENTSTTATIAATTTKKERRMGTIVFPPLALLSRSGTNGNSNRGSTNSVSGRSLFS